MKPLKLFDYEIDSLDVWFKIFGGVNEDCKENAFPFFHLYSDIKFLLC